MRHDNVKKDYNIYCNCILHHRPFRHGLESNVCGLHYDMRSVFYIVMYLKDIMHMGKKKKKHFIISADETPV